MYKVFLTIDEFIERLEKVGVVICFSILIVLVLMTILSRNLLHLPSSKLFEAAPAFVLWLSLLGASLALKQNRHIRLELVLRFCSDRVRSLAAFVANLSGAVIMGILFAASIEFVSNEIAMFGPWGRAAVIFPVFFMVSAFRYAHGMMLCLTPSIPKRNVRSDRGASSGE